MNNKSLGTKFEKDFARFLSDNGYWVAPFPGKEHTNSQPADLIACKNNNHWLIDCKTLSNKNGLFPISRIEDNQRLAYKRFKKCGNDNYCLSILWNNNIYIVPFHSIDFKQKSICLSDNFIEWRNFYEN